MILINRKKKLTIQSRSTGSAAPRNREAYKPTPERIFEVILLDYRAYMYSPMGIAASHSALLAPRSSLCL